MINKRYKITKARTGDLIPVLIDADVTEYPLHSTIEPRREAKRLIDTIEKEGFLVLLGLGGAYLLKAALERNDISKVIVIEYDKTSFNELLSQYDYLDIFEDPRVQLLVDPSKETIEDKMLNLYKPVLYDGIRVIPLRSRTRFDSESFTMAGEAIITAINRVSLDYSVQAHFGKRWFSNIIKNVKKSYRVKQNIPSINHAVICAAGPSLSKQLKKLKTGLKETFIIATDTSLPCLLNENIVPDAVISIDAQIISYYHFMNGLPEDCYLFLDLLSPPLLASLSKNTHFFSGGHPLTRLISSIDNNIFLLDTSGANVTFAAISLAEYLGAQEIEVFGADYCYPNGNTYAKGAYIYSYYEFRQNRFLPLEAQASAFLYRTPLEKKYHSNGSWYYETSTLKFYREKHEEKSSRTSTATQRLLGKESAKVVLDPDIFINQYTDGLEILANPGKNAAEFLALLTDKEQTILTTILPVAAALKKRNPEWDFRKLLKETRDYCLSKL